MKATAEIHIRVPGDLSEWIARTAEDEHRSVNGQCNAMLALARSVIIKDKGRETAASED